MRLVSYLQKIPLFEDITTSTTRKILSICTKINLKEGQILCKQGSPSNSMYILLYGKLVVTVGDSNPIATIDPVSCIGEMGVFTAEPRSANVNSLTNSGLLSIRASDLNALVRKEPDFGVKIMSKVIKILAERLNADNRGFKFQVQYFG